MPRFVRVLITAFSFLQFFVVGMFFSVLLLPITPLLLRAGERTKKWLMVMLGKSMALFSWYLRFSGMIGYERPQLPASVDPDKGFVLVSNHPSYIDVVLLMGFLPGLTSVVKSAWVRSWILGPLLRATHQLPGHGLEGDEGEHPALDRMVGHLQAGHSLVIFPEGSRSLKDKLRRFRRGGVEAAIAAGVPIVPVFIGVDRAFLTKGEPWYRVPSAAAKYTFQWLDPIDTREPGADARAINSRIQKEMKRLFELSLEQRVDRTLPASVDSLDS